MNAAATEFISLQAGDLRFWNLFPECRRMKTPYAPSLPTPKYIEGVKRAISDSNKFVQLNITPDKYLNYNINIEKKIK